MKTILPAFLSVLFIVFTGKDSNAQTTYNITSNTSWSTLVGYGCTNCIFNITAGKTLTLDQNYGSCGTCTFTGGTVNITQNFSFYTGVSFTNETLLMNGAATFQASTFNNDTIAVNQAATFYTGSTFTGDRISINAGTTIQGSTFSNDSLHMANQALTLQGSGTNSFTSSNFTISGTSAITSTTSISLTNSVFTYKNTSSFFNNGGTFTSSGSTQYLNDNTYFNSTSGVVLKNNSEILVGDGTLASTAYMLINSGTALNIVDNSLIKVSNGNNSYQNNSAYTYTSSGGATTSYNTSTNTISCGGVNPHACTANYVYGCATLNSAGAAGCIILAIAGPDLSIVLVGTNTVALSWSDNGNDNTENFQVQRNTSGQDWITIGTVAASRYSNGEYHFNDAAADAGKNSYRLLVTDKDGHTTYSKINTVSITPTRAAISVYPNPVTGQTFFVGTASADPILVNVFTLSGQLLFRTSLKGQTVYPVKLPVSTPSGNYIVVQVIGNTGTQAFNLLNQ